MLEKIGSLKAWCPRYQISPEKINRVFDMLKLDKRDKGAAQVPIQFPACYLQDAAAGAWRELRQYTWVKLLKDNFEAIQKEALNIFEKNLMDVHPENDDLAGYGTWNTFFFYKNGEKYIKNLKRRPFTASILSKIPGVDIAGRAYFSAMTPGAHIKPYCSSHNFKLKTHLGIVTAPEAVIRVADETRPWITGKCIVFDDSFKQEVWNKSNIASIVLIVDVWNSCLSREKKLTLEYISCPNFTKEARLHEAVL